MITEKDFQAAVTDLLDMTGWQWYHTHDSRRSRQGWPDLAMWRDGKFLLRELKTDDGKLTPWQEATIESLAEAGVDVGVWRPADWPDIERFITEGWDASV